MGTGGEGRVGGPGARHLHPPLLQLQVCDDLVEGRVGDEGGVGGGVPEVIEGVLD